MSASMTWQPIATAPRDGTPVDLWHKDGFRVMDEWWDDECWCGNLWGDDQFTHWMLVTPPGSEK